jgi:Leucine-rich repeat (LRR) protein
MKYLLIFIFLLNALTLPAQSMEIAEEAERTSDAELDRALKYNRANISMYDEIPSKILDNKELTKLVISSSYKIKYLPNKLGRLVKVTQLLLNGTGLERFPKPVLKLKKLEELQLTNCYITEISSGINALSDLKRLTLNTMPITSLPDELGELSQLEFLSLESLYGNYRIGGRSVKLEGIQTLPESIGDLTALVDLRASRMGLERLPERIGELKALKSLRLGGNLLVTIPESIGDLEHLEVLHLSKNPLESLPESIVKLKNLRSLSLDHSTLTHLPESIKQLKNLKGLFVIGTEIPDAKLRSIQVALPDLTIYNSKGKKL